MSKAHRNARLGGEPSLEGEPSETVHWAENEGGLGAGCHACGSKEQLGLQSRLSFNDSLQLVTSLGYLDDVQNACVLEDQLQ